MMCGLVQRWCSHFVRMMMMLVATVILHLPSVWSLPEHVVVVLVPFRRRIVMGPVSAIVTTVTVMMTWEVTRVTTLVLTAMVVRRSGTIFAVDDPAILGPGPALRPRVHLERTVGRSPFGRGLWRRRRRPWVLVKRSTVVSGTRTATGRRQPISGSMPVEEQLLPMVMVTTVMLGVPRRGTAALTLVAPMVLVTVVGLVVEVVLELWRIPSHAISIVVAIVRPVREVVVVPPLAIAVTGRGHLSPVVGRGRRRPAGRRPSSGSP